MAVPAKILIAATVLVLARASAASADDPVSPARETSDPSIVYEDSDRAAAVDYGPGPGLPRPDAPASFWSKLKDRFSSSSSQTSTSSGAATAAVSNATVAASATSAATSSAAVPTGGSKAGTQGLFGSAIAWPIIPIHLALLPDGRVLSYGTTETGAQSGQFNYDVWNPSLGTGSSSHLELPNKTNTDLFCSGQALMANGTVLLTGGDLTVSGKRNYSNNKTNIFNPSGNTLTASSSMKYPRWYPSLLTLPGGDMLVMGGRTAPYQKAILPELYTSGSGWRTLTSANSYGIAEWYYPKSFVGPNGTIYMVNTDGRIFTYTTANLGGFSKSVTAKADPGDYDRPAVQYAPGMVLAMRANDVVDVINLTGSQPSVKKTSSLGGGRYWESATVLADGTVFVNGGSAVANVLTGVSYTSYIWHPSDGEWTLAGTATKPRLYHSNALLLADGTVLTGGGGAPGPVNNLNAEIYYPPYLYSNNGSGAAASRPVIASAPSVVHVGTTFSVTMQGSPSVSRVTLLRAGAATHSTNLQQAFFDVKHSQSGSVVKVTAPTNANQFLPGYYLLFAFDSSGVPSSAHVFEVPAT